MLSNQQFEKTQRLALSLAGIELAERHKELLETRTRRLGIQDSSGVDLLLEGAEKGDPKARRQLLGLVTTKHTGFFRHPAHFEIAADHALRVVLREGRARLWCAAVATGEEPYSLGMALIEMFGREDPPVKVFATDLDERALAVVVGGEYTERALCGLQPQRRERFLCPSSKSGCWSIVAAVRQLVEFQPLNLTGVSWPVEGPFDVILCRNVLMYLEACHRYAVLERMASLLALDGLLMLDPTEHLGKAGHFFTSTAEAVFLRHRTRASALPKMSVRSSIERSLRT